MRKRLSWPLAVTGVAGLTVGIAWVYRTPIVTSFVDRTLAERGIDASYTIENMGLRTQRLSNVRIGPAAAPDLTARSIELRIAIGIDGPTVIAVKGRGVRLNGRWTGDRLTLGQIDRLLPQDSNKPFALPDIEVDLADSAMRLATPWGPVGIGAAGTGHLQRSFDGLLAVNAPRLALAGCSAGAVTGHVRVAVRRSRPSANGPLGIARLACPGQGLALTDARFGLTAEASPDLADWTLRSGIRSAAVRGPSVAAAALAGQVSVQSDGDGAIAADWRLTAHRAASAWVDARSLTIAGNGHWDGADALSSAGTVSVAGASAASRSLARIAAFSDMDDSTPVGPLARKLGAALAAAGRGFAGSGRYSVTQVAGPAGSPARLEASVGETRLRSASGADVSLGGERPVTWTSAKGLAFDTQLAMAGGGLPEGSVALRRPGGSAPITGEARFAPYAAGSAALALAPLRFIADRNGQTRFSTGIALTGPLAGGSVDRLSLPVSGQLAPDGTLTIDGGCRSLGWRGLASGSIRLDPASLRLCGEAGRPLLAIGPRGISGGARLPAFALAGRAGRSPLRLASSGGEVRLGAIGFTLAGVEASVGSGDAATRFAAARLTGATQGGVLGGTMEGAAGKIGPVPFLLSEADGRWTFARGRLSLDTSLSVEDAAEDDRFEPLLSDAIMLAFEDGRIAATGRLIERVTGTPVVDLAIAHDLSDATGSARFTVPTIRFDPDGLQPGAISRLAGGVVANVDGSVTGSGQLRWTADGVTSSGDFTTRGMNLAGAFGPVRDLSGTIRFDDLLALSTPPGQFVTVASINPGIEVVDGRIDYQLLPEQRVRIEGGRWPFAGGQLVLQPALLQFDAESARRLTFDVQGADAALFLQRYEFDNLSATGIFDGALPTVFDAEGGRIEGGSLVSRDGGGTIAYVGELSNRDLSLFPNLAFNALKALRYDSLVIRLNGRIDGEMLTEVRFAGLGLTEGANRNILSRVLRRLPVIFTININAPFQSLLSSARRLYDPTLDIDQNLQALARRAREDAAAAAEAAAAAKAMSPTGETGQGVPVQPRESEDQP